MALKNVVVFLSNNTELIKWKLLSKSLKKWVVKQKTIKRHLALRSIFFFVALKEGRNYSWTVGLFPKIKFATTKATKAGKTHPI